MLKVAAFLGISVSNSLLLFLKISLQVVELCGWLRVEFMLELYCWLGLYWCFDAKRVACARIDTACWF